MNSNRNGAFVPSSEAERFTLHQTLRGLMPEAVADTLMAHLPPGGWSDIARTSDIVALREATKHDIDEFRTATKVQFEQLAAATRHDLAPLTAATKRDIDDLRTATKHDIDELRIRVDRLEAKIDNLASMKRYVVTTGLALAGLLTGFGFAILSSGT
jgi:hypothetical protein